jgi:hypothetical protein
MAKDSSNTSEAQDVKTAQVIPVQKPPQAKSIRQHLRETDDRIAEVMNKSGKRPGSLVAFHQSLQDLLKDDHKLLDATF